MAGGSKIISAIGEAAPKAGLAFKSLVNKEAAQTLGTMATHGGEAAAKGGMSLFKMMTVPLWGPFWLVGKGLGMAASSAVKGTAHMASRPFVWADALGGKAISSVGNLYANHRTAAVIGTVGAGALTAGHFMNKHAEQRANMQVAQLESMQQQAAMTQAQANTVTPAEYAAMEARMRQGGQNGGFAAGVQAERASQPNVSGPAA